MKLLLSIYSSSLSLFLSSCSSRLNSSLLDTSFKYPKYLIINAWMLSFVKLWEYSYLFLSSLDIFINCRISHSFTFILVALVYFSPSPQLDPLGFTIRLSVLARLAYSMFKSSILFSYSLAFSISSIACSCFSKICLSLALATSDSSSP